MTCRATQSLSDDHPGIAAWTLGAWTLGVWTLDMSDIDPDQLRRALGTYPTGVAIVTATAEDGRPVAMTINSFTSVSLDPPLVLWSVDRGQPLFAAFSRVDHYAVHILRHDQGELAHHFANDTGDRFRTIETRAGIAGLPILSDYCALFQCAVEARHKGGDHLILIGRVLQIELTPAQPLVYHAGDYRLLA